MCHVFETVSNMSANHWPSVCQSLLCGLSDVGELTAPANEGPTEPTSPGAAEATVGAVRTPRRTRTAKTIRPQIRVTVPTCRTLPVSGATGSAELVGAGL